MFSGEVFTDYNGVCLFEPTRLKAFYDSISEGENLLKKFTSTDDGDLVLQQGIIVPILAIDDAGYEVIVRNTGKNMQVLRIK